MKHLDLYSCFPCVVQLAADTLGMKHDDPRGFTITGGLPFYGQLASTCCIPAMVDRLRQDTTAFGLITGNGGYAQKHSAGLYSATPPRQAFQLPDLEKLQAGVDARPTVAVNTAPRGPATVESFTVHHNQENRPTRAVIVGRLQGPAGAGSGSGDRFLANADVNDPEVVKRMMGEEDCLGAQGEVFPGEVGQPNRFVFAERRS